MPDENSNGGVQSNQSTAQNQSGNDFVLDFGDEEKEDKIIKQENQEVIKEENLPEDLGQDTEFKVDINPETPTEENSINPENEREIEEEKDSQDESFDISFDTDSDKEENKDNTDNTEENGENDSQSPMDDSESVEKSDEESTKFDSELSEGDIDQPLEFTFDDNTVDDDKPTEENKGEDDFPNSEGLNQNSDENIEDGDNNLFKEDDKISADENINSEEDNNIYVEDKVDEKSNSEEENLNSEDLFEENDEDLNTNSDETTENLEDNIVTDEENIEEKDIDVGEENETQNEEFTPDDSELNNAEENNGIVLDFDNEPSENVGQIATGEVDNQENISVSEEEKIVDDENIENESDESIQFNFAEDNLENNENEEISNANNTAEDTVEETPSESDFVVDFNSEDNLQNNIEDNSENDSHDILPENEEQEPQIQPDIQTFGQEQDTFEGQESSQNVESEIKQPEISDLLGDESTNIPSNEQNNQLPDDSESQSSDFTLSPSEDNKFEATVDNNTQSGEIPINNENNNTTIQENSELQQNVPTVQPENNIGSEINEQSFPQFQLDTDIVNNQNNPQNNVNETVNNQPETLEMKSTLSLDQILDSELTNNPQFMNESKANPQNVVSNGGFFKKNLVGIVIGVSLFVLAGFVAILAFPSKTTERKTGDTVAIQTPEEGHFAGEEQEVEVEQDTQTENGGIIEENLDYDTDYNMNDTQIAKSEIVFPDAEGEDEINDYETDKIEPYHEDNEFNEDPETNTETITADEILEVISDFKSAAEKYYSQGDLLQDKKLIKYSLQAINICDVYKNQVDNGEGISQEELDNFKSRITTSITKIETYMGGTEDIDLFVQDGSQDSYDFEGKEEVKNFIYDRANGLYQ